MAGEGLVGLWLPWGHPCSHRWWDGWRSVIMQALAGEKLGFEAGGEKISAGWCLELGNLCLKMLRVGFEP